MPTRLMPEMGPKAKKVMKEYKAGRLMSSSGKKVTNPRQAMAIAFSEERRLMKK